MDSHRKLQSPVLATKASKYAGLKNALSSKTQDGSKFQCLHLALEDAGRAGCCDGHN